MEALSKIKNVKKQLLMYINYHQKLGNYRPIFFSKDDLSTDVAELISKCAKLYQIKRCHCCYGPYFIADKKKVCASCIYEGPIFCHQCRKFRLYDDFSEFSENPKTTQYDRCSYCNYDKFPPEEIINEDIVLSLLKEKTDYILQECLICSQDFAFKTRDKYRAVHPEKCGECRKLKLDKCTYCHKELLPREYKKCNMGCCTLCQHCVVKCDKCIALGLLPQCPKTKKCVRLVGEKRRVTGRVCRECNIQKSISCNSKGRAISEDKCPHPWCIKCEKHSGIYHPSCLQYY